MISESYQQVLIETHLANPVWGNGHSNLHLETVVAMQPKSIIDYGCGKGSLVNALLALGVDAEGYDPGVAEFSHPILRTYDLLTAFDVLEHIEAEYLTSVLTEMVQAAPRALMTISLVTAKKVLSDGRNAHLIVKDADWWRAALAVFWTNVEVLSESHKELRVLCSR